MCDPLTIGSLALGALGIGANSIAASRVAASRNRAMQMQNTLKQNLQSEADATTAKSLKRYDDAPAQAKQRGQEITSFVKGNDSQGPSADLVPQSSNTLVTNDELSKRATARKFTDGQAEALGDLRGFGSILGDNSLGQARDAQKVGMLGGFMTSNANYLPMQLDAANHSMDGLKGFGNLATQLGTAGMGAGLSGMPFMGLPGTAANESALRGLTGAGGAGGAAGGGGGGLANLGLGSGLLSLFGGR